MSLSDRLADIPACNLDSYVAFTVNGVRVGSLLPRFVAHLSPYPDVFTISGGSVALSPGLKTARQRTLAVARCLRELREQGLVPGWRDESYPVSTGFSATPLFLIERAAAALFGIRVYAVNLSGFVRTRDGLSVWVAHRAMTKQTSPGKLDSMVSGGQPAGVTVRENLIKECAEEANIPESLARQSIATGGISFCTERPEGVLLYFQFNHDLELPADFTPLNTDGEVAEFQLWPVDRLLDCVANTRDFAYDSALVAIDFMLRHGVIEADHPEYINLVLGLRSGFGADALS